MKHISLLTLGLAVASTAMAQNAVEINGLYYSALSDSTCEVVANPNEYSGAVVIPGTVEYRGTDLKVIGIGESAFEDNDDITSLEMGPNIQYIKRYGLYSADQIVGVMKLPACLTELGYLAFGDNNELTAFEVDPANPKFCSLDGVLYTKDLSTLLCAPGHIQHAVLPEATTTLSDNCFEWCVYLEDVKMNETLQNVGNEVFWECQNLQALNFPASVVSLGEDFMYHTHNLKTVTVAEGNPCYESHENCIYNPGQTELLFVGGGVTNLNTIPQTCTSIAGSAAYGIKWLNTVVIPDQVTSVGEYAFSRTYRMHFLTIGSGMQTIGKSNFISDSLETITCYAPVPPTLGDYCFEGDDYLDWNYTHATLYVPEGSIDAYKEANLWNKFEIVEPLKEAPAEYEYAATVEVLTPRVQGLPDQWLQGVKVKITNTGKNPITNIMRHWENLDHEGNGNGWDRNFDPAIQPGESVECDMWNMICSASLEDGLYHGQFFLESAEDEEYDFENPIEERTGNFEFTVGNVAEGIVPPYFNNFTADDAIEGWTLIDGNGDDDLWTQEDGYLKAPYNDDIPMDDWIFTPAFSFEGGMSYPFSVDVRINKEVYAPEKMEIMYGTEPTVEGMTQQIMEPTEFSSNTWATYCYTLAPATTGLYYIGLHCITDPDKTQLHVTNFTVGAPTTTGINSILGNDTEAVYYDLMGRMVANPQHGIFIRKAGNKATKVIL